MTGALLGYLCGISSYPLFDDTPLDSGMATLLGAALGAGITVSGSMWVASYQSVAQERSFRRFVADTVIAIRDEAYVLLALLEIEDWDDNGQYAKAILDQISNLTEVIELFRDNAPYEEIGRYDDRINITRLERSIIRELSVIEKEVNWLKAHHTRQVITNAQRDLSEATLRISTAAVVVHQGLGYDPPMPSEKDVERRIGWVARSDEEDTVEAED